MPTPENTTIKSLPTKVEEIALEIGAALSGRGIYRTSIHDATGAALWNSDTTVDEAEFSFVLDALDALALGPSRLSFERESGKGRGLVALHVRS